MRSSRASVAERQKPVMAKPREEKQAEDAKAPREERQPREDRPPRQERQQPAPQARRKEPVRDRRPSPSGDVPDSDGFHSGNMPAFLLRPVRSA
jgi:ribonuclease E